MEPKCPDFSITIEIGSEYVASTRTHPPFFFVSIWDHTASSIMSGNLRKHSLSSFSLIVRHTCALNLPTLAKIAQWCNYRPIQSTNRTKGTERVWGGGKARLEAWCHPPPLSCLASLPLLLCPPSLCMYTHKSKQEGDVFNQKRKERWLNKSCHLSCNNARLPGCICAYLCLRAYTKRAARCICMCMRSDVCKGHSVVTYDASAEFCHRLMLHIYYNNHFGGITLNLLSSFMAVFREIF